MAELFDWQPTTDDPHQSMNKAECKVCGLFTVRDSISAAAADIYNHVVRCHPAVYEEVVGHPPIPEQVQATTYGLLEGLVPIECLEI